MMTMPILNHTKLSLVDTLSPLALQQQTLQLAKQKFLPPSIIPKLILHSFHAESSTLCSNRKLHSYGL